MFKNIKTLKYFYRKIFNPKVVKHHGVTLDLNSKYVSPWIKDAIYKGFYENSESKLLNKYISKNDIILEIGGGIGFIGCRCKKAKNIIIYEANPNLIKLIKNNLFLNEIKAEIYNFAVVSSQENLSKINFYIGENYWNASIVKKENFEEIPIETVKIDFLIEKHSPTFLIIDVEGYEYELLKDIKLPNNIKKILIEYHPKVITNKKINYINEILLKNKFKFKNKSRDSIIWLRD